MRSELVRGRVRTVAGVVLAAVISSAVAASPAIAQGQPGRGGGGGGMMRMGGMGRDVMEPPVNSADVERYATILALTPDQKEAAKALLEAAMAEFQPAARETREKMEQIREEFRDSGDPSVWQGMGPIMQDFRKVRTSTEAAFMSDVQMLLTEEQAAKWPVVERTHRRERTLARGLMSGERVDLIKLVDELDMSPEDRAAIGAVLEQYEVDLDRELIKRNEVYDQGESQAQELMQDFQNGDMTRAQEMFAKGREASKRVKDVNQRYARQLENLLPEAKRQAFSDRFKQQSFPMIYRETYASRVLTAAEKMGDLDETQRSSLAALREGHARELAALNAKLQAEAEERENSADMMQMFRGGGGRNDELRTARRELDSSTVQRVRDLLTEAQREQLPAREQAVEGRQRFEVTGDGQQRRRRGGGDDNDDDDNDGEQRQPRRRRGGGDRDPAPTPPPPPEPR